MSLAEDVKQKAIDLGLDLVGITDAAPLSTKQIDYFTAWLKSGCAGRMSYMHRNFQKRTNPAKLLRNAKSVICTALNYKPATTPEEPQQDSAKGKIANYALYEDYHQFIKKRLYSLADFITACAGRSFAFKVCVDSVPVAERALAARAGIGFIGKNRMLINPSTGPQLLLGEIVTDLPLETDEPLQTTCSGCEKCIAACPSGALGRDGGFEANKCISYLTIEHKGKIDPDLSTKLGCRLFGCDECVLACPYQENTPACANKEFKLYPDRKWLNLREILDWNQKAFARKLGDSPLKRCGLDKLKQNAAICLENISRERNQGARKISSSQTGISQPR